MAADRGIPGGGRHTREAWSDYHGGVRPVVVLLLAFVVTAAWWLLPERDMAPPGSLLASGPAEAALSVAAGVPAGEGDEGASASSPMATTAIPAIDAPPGSAANAAEAVAAPGTLFVVVDEAGAPIAGALVVAVDGEHDLASAATDAAGVAELHGVPAEFAFRITAPGFWPASGRRLATNGATRVVLATAPVLRGRVFDGAGRPVAGARAVLLPPVEQRVVAPPALPPGTPVATTDAAGQFVVPWPDDLAHDLVVTARGHATFVAGRLTAAAQGALLFTVTLQTGAVVQGAAKCAAGAPLALARVEVWSTDVAPGGAPVGRPLPWRERHLLATTATDRNGSFAFEDLSSTVNVTIGLAPDHGGTPWAGFLSAGAVTRLELTAAVMAGIRGTVEGAATGAEVFLYGGPRFLRTTSIAHDGSFAFADVPPGAWLLGVAVPPLADTLHLAAQEWQVGGTTRLAMAIDIAPGESRTVALVVPAAATGVAMGTAFVAGAPAAGHEVTLRPVTGEGAFVRRAAVGAAGDFTCDGLRPGDYVAELCQRPGAPVLASQPCRIHGGVAARVTLIAR